MEGLKCVAWVKQQKDELELASCSSTGWMAEAFARQPDNAVYLPLAAMESRGSGTNVTILICDGTIIST